jgi:pimeloyl-ACP methyl ester carboxylesterase
MERRLEVNGLRFRVLDEGTGEPVLLLHGFPDSSRLWRHQVPFLVDAGFRVVAPDLRGFGESEKPAAAEAYQMPVLVGDVVGLLDALGLGRVRIVSHDWGAVVGWLLAAMLPERVDRLVAMSVGHPGSFARPTIEQREKSWYMLFFQFAGVAEEQLARDDWTLLREWGRGHAEAMHWIADLTRPGALTAALNWYRANVHPAASVASDAALLPAVRIPVLGMWSTGDALLTEVQMTASARFVTGGWRYERVEDASHWLQLDQPARVNASLRKFLG